MTIRPSTSLRSSMNRWRPVPSGSNGFCPKTQPTYIGKIATAQNLMPPRETTNAMRSCGVMWTSFRITASATGPDRAPPQEALGHPRKAYADFGTSCPGDFRGGLVGLRIFGIVFLVLLVNAGVVVASEEPRPVPLSPVVWVDFGGRSCDSPAHVPCLPSIAIALGVVDPGGTIILLHNATYFERPLVSRSVTILGESIVNSSVDGGFGASVFSIAAFPVILQNVTIQNAQEAVQVGAPSATLDGVRIRNASVGVKTYGATPSLTLRNVDIENADGAAVLATQADLLRLDNVTVRGGGMGLGVSDSSGIVVTKSAFQQMGGVGVALVRATNATVGPNVTVSDGGDRGISVDSGQGITVRGNTIANNAFSGLNISASVNVTVEGNVITNNGALGIPPRGPGPAPSPLQGGGGGARFWITDPVRIANNTISGNAFFGLAIGGSGSTDYTLEGNTVANNSGPGLIVSEGAARIDVSGQFNDNHGDGVLVDNATGVSLHG